MLGVEGESRALGISAAVAAAVFRVTSGMLDSDSIVPGLGMSLVCGV